jgi:hypothetical protein
MLRVAGGEDTGVHCSVLDHLFPDTNGERHTPTGESSERHLQLWFRLGFGFRLARALGRGSLAFCHHGLQCDGRTVHVVTVSDPLGT